MKGNKGITLIALTVTIIVLIILASISIAALNGENSVVKQATEAQILTELSNVKEALEIYKIRNYSDGDMSDEELVEEGLLKEVFINDTFRTIAVITNLKTIDINSKLGKGGEKQEELEEATLLDLYNVYGIDMSDGTLYYIRNGVWSIDGNKVTYTADTGEEKEGYVVETINEKYLEDRKFITEWTVEAGTTITLPINQEPNITIEWGADDDGDGELDVEQCTIVQPTHTYKETGTYTIKISGNMKEWLFSKINTSKDYITGLKQWGNIGIEEIDFSRCINLEGTIPEHKTKGEFLKLIKADSLFRECSKLEGEISENIFEDATNAQVVSGCFCGCTGLTGNIPEKLLADCINVTNIDSLFYNCPNLTGSIPENIFANSTKITRMNSTFYKCSGLTGSIPAKLFEKNTELKVVSNIFWECKGITGKIPEALFKNCSKLESIGSAFAFTSINEIPPDIFDINKGDVNGIKDLTGVFGGTLITEIPTGLFDLCTEVTKFGIRGWLYSGVFQNCKLLESIPDKLFYENKKVTDFSSIFRGCSSLKTIPENLLYTEQKNVFVTNMFAGCSSLTKIPGTLFSNVPNISDYEGLFSQCGNLTEIGAEFKISEDATNLSTLFSGCRKLSKTPQKLIIPESVTKIQNMFTSCSELKTTIILKTIQAEYNEFTFRGVNSESRVNWMSPCTEEFVDAVLTESENIAIKGIEVTE